MVHCRAHPNSSAHLALHSLGDTSLADTAISSFIESPLEGGWDQEHGGVFYFMDAKRKLVDYVISLQSFS